MPGNVRVVLRHVADARANLERRAPRRRGRARASGRVGHEEAEQRLDHRALAGAVRAEQPDGARCETPPSTSRSAVFLPYETLTFSSVTHRRSSGRLRTVSAMHFHIRRSFECRFARVQRDFSRRSRRTSARSRRAGTRAVTAIPRSPSSSACSRMNPITFVMCSSSGSPSSSAPGDEVLALDAARERLVLHPLHHRTGLEVQHALARTHERRGGDEARHLVAGEQRLLERAVARDAAVVGVRQDRSNHPLRVAVLAQDLAAPERMILERRPALVIEIVEERRRRPSRLRPRRTSARSRAPPPPPPARASAGSRSSCTRSAAPTRRRDSVPICAL